MQHTRIFFFWYICIFVTLRRKPGILNTRLIFFLQHKKNSDLKINMPENHKYLSLSFIFWRKKNSRSGLVTCPSKWPGWTQKGCSYSLIKAGGLLFKWINSLEQYTHKVKCMQRDTLLFKWIKIHLNSANTKKTNACKRWREQTWRRRSCNNVESVMVAWSVFVCFKPFPSVLYLRLFLAFSFLCVFVTLSTGSCTFFSPVLQILFAEKIEQRLKVSPYFFLVSPLFFSFFSFFSSTTCLPDLTAMQGWRKKPPLFSVFFLS